MLGNEALGIYTLAYRLPELIIQSIWRVVAGAVFPFFSAIQDRADLLRDGFLATIRYTQLVIVPLCLGLVVTAGPAVHIIFGSQWDEAIPVLQVMAVFSLTGSIGVNVGDIYKWDEAIPVLQVMAVFSLTGSIGVNVGDIYKAIGRPDILAKLAAAELTVLVPALLFGSRFGLIGIAWAHAIVALVDTLVRLTVARRFVGVTFADIGRQLLPSLTAGGVLLAVAIPTAWATRDLGVYRGEVVLEDAGWGCPAECSVGSVVIVEMHEPGVGAGPLGF